MDVIPGQYPVPFPQDYSGSFLCSYRRSVSVGRLAVAEWQGWQGQVLALCSLLTGRARPLFTASSFQWPIMRQRSDTQHTRFRPLWAFATALAARMSPTRAGGTARPRSPSRASIRVRASTAAYRTHLPSRRSAAASSCRFLADISPPHPFIKTRCPSR